MVRRRGSPCRLRKTDRGRRITRLLKRDGTNCWLCGLTLSRRVRDHFDPSYITFDHVIPLSKGGIDHFSNIRLAHQKCNGDRGNSMFVFRHRSHRNDTAP